MILSQNYSLWFEDWHWNNNQQSHRVHRNPKMTQQWTEGKGEPHLAAWLWESWKPHSEAKLLRHRRQHWAESFPLQPCLSYSAHAGQSELPQKQPGAGADGCLCSNRWFPFSPSNVMTLKSASAIPTGARAPLCVREVALWGAKGGRCSRTLLQKKLPDEIKKMKMKDALHCSKIQSLFQPCKS